jgi:hypothetical protein
MSHVNGGSWVSCWCWDCALCSCFCFFFFSFLLLPRTSRSFGLQSPGAGGGVFMFVFLCGCGLFNVTVTFPNSDTGTGGGDIAGSFTVCWLLRVHCALQTHGARLLASLNSVHCSLLAARKTTRHTISPSGRRPVISDLTHGGVHAPAPLWFHATKTSA